MIVKLLYANYANKIYQEVLITQVIWGNILKIYTQKRNQKYKMNKKKNQKRKFKKIITILILLKKKN